MISLEEIILAGTVIKSAALAVPIIIGYSTIANDELLENDNRRKAHNLIAQNPGVTFTNLMDELGIKNGALAYHLYTLERRRFIKSVKDGKYKRFYPRGVEISGLSGNQEKIFDFVCEKTINGDEIISQRNIANALELTPQTVNHNVKGLITAGRVYLEKDGKHTRVIPTDSAMKSYETRQTMYR